MPSLTQAQQRLLDAIDAGATIRRRGWQELSVDFGARDSRNYMARENTLCALRDRGFIALSRDGITRLDEASS